MTTDAREFVHALAVLADNPCGGTDRFPHTARCDSLVILVEARDARTVERCARAAEKAYRQPDAPFPMELEFAVARIRKLAAAPPQAEPPALPATPKPPALCASVCPSGELAGWKCAREPHGDGRHSWDGADPRELTPPATAGEPGKLRGT